MFNLIRTKLKRPLAQVREDFYSLVFIGCTFFLMYSVAESIWHSKLRAEINHGINLPADTDIMYCTGFLFNIDGHTTTKGMFPRTELAGFLAQLTVESESREAIESILYITLECKPFIGDALTIRYSLSEAEDCYFYIDSDWN